MEHTQTGDFSRSGAVKRMLSLVLAFVMLLSLLPPAVMSRLTGRVENWLIFSAAPSLRC